MAFNIALSGLQAASSDLDVSGNNIANASTVGFKGSRAEFGDLYANGIVGQGSTAIGGGVKVQTVRQQFAQGNISATNNGLDAAIDGNGFFVLNNNGETLYSRAGQFGLDKNGYIVNNQGMKVQGFQADSQGNLNGITGDIQVHTGDQPPRRTTLVNSKVNLDSTQSVLAIRGTTLTSDGALAGDVVYGTTNSIPAETWTINYPDGSSGTVSTKAGVSAGSIAGTLSQQDGVSVSARTTAIIPSSGFSAANGDTLTINGVPFTIDTSGAGGLANLANSINSSSLIATTAVFDKSGNLQLISSQGADLSMQYAGTGSVKVNGENGSSSVTLDGNAGSNSATVSGMLNITLDNGVTLSPGSNQIVATTTGTPFVKNTFNPQDQQTYNFSTSTNIYDSLGNSHVLTQYFVKEPSTGPNPANLWTMYVQIDGQNVGDPNTALPSPQNTQPTQASYNLVFNNDGSLNTTLSDPVLISNWVPLDKTGNPNGADGPLNVANGGTLPIPDPPTSSNFQIDMNNSTQYGSASAVNNVAQNGYTTGKLTGLDVSQDGVISANYSNSQSQVLAQLAMAKFQDNEGLAPKGNTTWAETYASGNPVIGKPGTSSLGSIQSSSVEESNVDLSKELVNLITAQRNYQANAKTIQTANAVTQTIINLR